MQVHAEARLYLNCELRARQGWIGTCDKLHNFGSELQRAAPSAGFVEQPAHAGMVEGRSDQIKRGTRIAVLFGCRRSAQSVDDMSAQHLVLHLDLVEDEEEGFAASEKGCGDRLGPRMQEPGFFKDVTPGRSGHPNLRAAAHI